MPFACPVARVSMDQEPHAARHSEPAAVREGTGPCRAEQLVSRPATVFEATVDQRWRSRHCRGALQAGVVPVPGAALLQDRLSEPIPAAARAHPCQDRGPRSVVCNAADSTVDMQAVRLRCTRTRTLRRASRAVLERADAESLDHETYGEAAFSDRMDIPQTAARR